ncbi:MAG: RES family NAD+ phosphorylase [Verrucomicrobia bacterium]|nr:RES family NAD+ phosphorylase [Verrucomicrobiota bacterium]
MPFGTRSDSHFHVIRTRFILFLLAAFLGWLPCARASLPALRDRLVSAHVQETRETESTAWELVDVQPFGHADDGTPLTLFVFVELPDPFDMFSPVSTRAGPKTHTRVLYVVQPFLGLDAIRISKDGGVWWVLDGVDREVYLGVASVQPRFFGLMTSVSDEVQLNAAFGGGTVSRRNLNKLAAGNFFGHSWLLGQKFRTSTASQDSQIRNIIDQRLNPHGETRLLADTRMSAEEHSFRSNRALATSGLLLGSSMSGYDDTGAQFAEINANLYARSMLPSVVGTHAAQVFYAAEAGYILGNADSSGLEKGLAAFDLGLLFISLPRTASNGLPKGINYQGTVYRVVNPNYLDSAWKAHAGNFRGSHRYTSVGRGGVYAGTSRRAVLGEMRFYDLNPADMAWVSREVNVGNILDLTNPSVRRKLGVSLGQLTGDGYFMTHAIGDFAQSRYSGILFPSAREAGASHLLLFP